MLALPLLLVVGALGADETVLLNFSRASCAPCRAMEPVLGQLEGAGLPVQTINVDQQAEMAKRFQITGTPTYVMLANGRETGRIVGVTTLQKLQALYPPSNNAAPTETVRGQSPTEPAGSYLGQRMGAMFGNNPPASPQRPAELAGPSGDPFSARQSFGNPAPAQRPQADKVAAGNPQERAQAASVRLKVADPKGFSLGSGTIVDTHGDEAVLITCGHIFRASQGQGRITVDLFQPQPRTVEGKLIDFDLERDIAIVSLSGVSGAVAAPVAPQGTETRKADAAFSVGCDKGQDPTARQTKITNINRYQGPPNIEAAGEPTDGRSGGGLFNQQGELIGVCNAADPSDNEGIYAAIATIHGELDKAGLAELFTPRSAPSPNMLAAAPTAGNSPRSSAVPPRPESRIADDFSTAAPITPVGFTQEKLPAKPTSPGDTEVICIVRSKSNPSARGQVFLVDRASPEFLQHLAASSASPTAAADIALQADRRNNLPTALPRGDGPTVRGQSLR